MSTVRMETAINSGGHNSTDLVSLSKQAIFSMDKYVLIL